MDRQLRGALFERAILRRPKVSPAVTQLHPDAESIFKDSYLVDFLDLPEGHSEQELQDAIIMNLKRFLLELGRDFAFVGEQYLLQVGSQDFRLKLHEFYELAKPEMRAAGRRATRPRKRISMRRLQRLRIH
jgi:predicted nuclease of restriction endonuclease-like (RecB) superfamily